MTRFVVVVLDGFGVGAMPDVMETRPQDKEANTALNLINHFPGRSLPTLERLGLLNMLPQNQSKMNPNPEASWGKAMLAHEGCDTFMGHQEIMGSRPKPPTRAPFSQAIDGVEIALNKAGYQTRRIHRGTLALLEVNGCVVIGDNLEADLGQVYNLTANLNQISFTELHAMGLIVRKANTVGRNIAFGGYIDSMDAILNAIEIKQVAGISTYIGVDTPRTGVYEKGFQVVHLGFGIDATTQVPHCLTQVGIRSFLYGKVADIVQNEQGVSYPSIVDTTKLFSLLLSDIAANQDGFFCLNVQETDLSGHQQDPDRYWQILERADQGIAQIMNALNPEDQLIVMADHGNDPFIGHSQHTRELVPILVFPSKPDGHYFGMLTTLADVGASVAAFFLAPMPEFGRPTIQREGVDKEHFNKTYLQNHEVMGLA